MNATQPSGGEPGGHEDDVLLGGSHGGRARSWLAVSVILLGFILGGVALCLGPNWPLVWAGAGIIAAGGVIALLVDIFSDVIIDARRTLPTQEHHSPFEHRSRAE
jgi:hypothetical protein